MKKKQTLVDNDCVTISLNEEKNLIETTWLRQPTSAEFRKYISLIVAIAIEHKLPSLLFDIRKRNYIGFADQNWLIDDIFPQLTGTLKKVAYLTEVESFKLFDTMRLQEVMASNFESNSFLIDHFLDEKQAFDWLLS
ncbi:hypothetical protein [Pontibacter arcticus]|uniref:SpoIIAA-like n=1 Tax=Pontibacter arcticus TaxID=2080288 RepID=A0A364RF61_9BACT|nr:hypothetical protein [Pontibacter arcticus]RAU82914.1 hypothetical protein DP923_06610 [Pontibacter arcticus]